ncbi:DNA-binding protein [Primorskyibacter flagellatus]|uniref:DNA-binding protein n=1 Tax=Primorskyibacter flagellatus TaxID=1387277 RepID=UPI003A91D941
MAKRVSARRVKIHRQYTYDSAADAVGVTPHTVRAWRPAGLAVLDSQKPHLILGRELKRFLESRLPKTSRKLAPDEFYCMSCRAPRAPYGDMADYEPFNPARGRLMALCGVCETPCNKFVSLKMRDELAQFLAIATRHSC